MIVSTEIVAGPIFRTMLVRQLEDVSRAIGLDNATARDRLAAIREFLIRSEAGTAVTGNSGGLAAWQAKRVVAHIDAHLDETLTNEELAVLVRLSTSHFCRAFRASFGTTPHNFIVKRRVERAGAMMLGTSESLAAIASACGFSDQAHLSRMFRRHEGQAPATWRRRQMAEPAVRAS